MSVFETTRSTGAEGNLGAHHKGRLRRRPSKLFKRQELEPRCLLPVAKPLFKKNRDQDPSCRQPLFKKNRDQGPSSSLQKTLTSNYNINRMFSSLSVANSEPNPAESSGDSDAASITLQMGNLSLDETGIHDWFSDDEGNMSDGYIEEETDYDAYSPSLSYDGTEVYEPFEGSFSDEQNELCHGLEPVEPVAVCHDQEPLD